MQSIIHALGVPQGGLEYHLSRLLNSPSDSVEDISLRIHGDGFESWKTHLFNFVDRFRVERDSMLIHQAPISELDERLRALIASTVESLCIETGGICPAWCNGITALPLPWFVAGIESLKASALIESPVCFRARNVFVLNNFLVRA